MSRRSFPPPARCRCRSLCCAHSAYLCGEEPVGARVTCLGCERRCAEALAATARRQLVGDATHALYVTRLAAEVAPGVERVPFRAHSAAALCATLLTSGIDSYGYPWSSVNPDDHPFAVIRLADDTLPTEPPHAA